MCNNDANVETDFYPTKYLCVKMTHQHLVLRILVFPRFAFFLYKKSLSLFQNNTNDHE